MDIFQSLILGLVQGLTEFLPVSSSGHIILVSNAMGVEASLSMELIFHLATLAAVLLHYRKTLLSLIKKPFSSLSLQLLLSTVITAAIAFALRGVADGMQDGRLLPLFFSLTAVILVLSDVLRPKKRNGWLGCVVVGMVQGIAVIPGLSRSGSTISAAKFCGASDDEAADYSFLLSVPVIAGSAIVELISHPMENVGFLPIAAGLIAAFLSGLLALNLMTKFKSRIPSVAYSAYLVVLSAVLIILRFSA